MNKDIEYINTQIAQSKAKLFDLSKARDDEENKLFGLYGALETLQMLEQKQKAAAPAEQQREPSPLTAAVREAAAAEQAAFRAQPQDTSQIGAIV
ncbi:hypothetical protein BGLT_05169 [Caballeronia glathei]|uniref:Uncharacterized protein n=1 Tax=Caballeronia glathei TaxID=60547 RepID=A0A069PF63_9BURK|nr:hypothetical protein [Caballeronia glathei]KDR39195.1 hypothetical protein BG61_34135 [Caballeronia glathei]CDY76097.1 hypothetical protein BGLT_05169 [Caballeronia glathei]